MKASSRPDMQGARSRHIGEIRRMSATPHVGMSRRLNTGILVIQGTGLWSSQSAPADVAACCPKDKGASSPTEHGLKQSLSLRSIFDQLFEAFGPQGWWPTTPTGDVRPHYYPGEGSRHLEENEQWEIVVGAMLTQNTSWRNVESALTGLWQQGLMDLHVMGSAPLDRLAATVRPSGYFNQKAARLQNIAAYIEKRHNGNITDFLRLSTQDLRTELLSLNGVGPETADSILLYAAQVPRFVIDAYTRRILGRLGVVEPEIQYDELQTELESKLPREHELYNEFHALLVKLATTSCTTNPKCQSCCLNDQCTYFKSEYVEKAG